MQTRAALKTFGNDRVLITLLYTGSIGPHRLSLAPGTEKSGPLCLNNPLDLRFAAGETLGSRLLVDAMVILVAAILV